MTHKKPMVTIVIPTYNESAGIAVFHNKVKEAFSSIQSVTMRILYCDDGSSDSTVDQLRDIAEKDEAVSVVALSRNFGKEAALSAGIEIAVDNGSAGIMMCDADGQHPIEMAYKFIQEWQAGAKVVVGVRRESRSDSFVKRFGSSVFYRAMSHVSQQKLVPGSTDYRLIDAVVAREFIKLKEQGRMTRGLIDWLGFERKYIYFDAHERLAGEASYSTGKLVNLAIQAAVSMSFGPLYFFGYVGMAIVIGSGLLGVTVFIEQIIMRDPLGWNFTGTAGLAILIVFLVGLLMVSQGIVSLYLASIHRESRRRPVYIVDSSRSIIRK